METTVQSGRCDPILRTKLLGPPSTHYFLRYPSFISHNIHIGLTRAVTFRKNADTTYSTTPKSVTDSITANQIGSVRITKQRPVRVPIFFFLPWKSNMYYVFSVYVCCLICQTRKGMCHVVLQFMACPVVPYFFTYLIHGKIKKQNY